MVLITGTTDVATAELATDALAIALVVSPFTVDKLTAELIAESVSGALVVFICMLLALDDTPPLGAEIAPAVIDDAFADVILADGAELEESVVADVLIPATVVLAAAASEPKLGDGVMSKLVLK
ncbi:hypothetical protein BAUCODRAFT_148660 [Baudoinia panamericana UAMH 10762]|uniref:Uncharacterized protein n=1 Tax=Baudoinia panamericana (strain UAMH 10762) TaxID=717646 RepID=M2MGM7_BAUPA|nr:uncharacterized protein BAUCODRAFT_148660 [Baudoinia panamericana UAMH 10762]EMC95786.1 hypothetical protein BAUCODRAFT_148660 [Baudoinia panamericana UAMH 10762]